VSKMPKDAAGVNYPLMLAAAIMALSSVGDRPHSTSTQDGSVPIAPLVLLIAIPWARPSD
jgi:hypothetical protein